jgi:peptide/nickel transport system permease protein
VLRYIVSSVVRGLLTLFAVSIIVFGLARLTGDPLDVLAPVDMGAEDQAALAAKWGLDKPLPQQYLTFIGSAFQGDFGPSFQFPDESAGTVIAERLPRSLQLGVIGLLLTILIGVPLGILSAVRRGSLLDRVAKGIALFGQSVPEFWLALMMIWVFAVNLNLVPTSGRGGWTSAIMPSIVMATFGIAAVLRLFRSSMLDTLGTEYVKLARLKGLPKTKVIFKHALKPGTIPPLTFFGRIAVRMLTGATVIEVVFSWPGAGLLAFEAANARDFPVVQALALFTSAAIVLMNLATDVLYAYLDPRVRLGQRMVS